jgi:hypothetical protein
MAGTSAQGGTFNFKGTVATITAISVETPTAEVVDMTGAGDPVGYSVLVPTGAWTGGTITVDYIHQKAGNFDPQSLVRQVGQVTFSSAGYSVSKNVLLESASHGAQVGDLVKGTLKFRMTDYPG